MNEFCRVFKFLKRIMLQAGRLLLNPVALLRRLGERRVDTKPRQYSAMLGRLPNGEPVLSDLWHNTGFLLRVESGESVEESTRPLVVFVRPGNVRQLLQHDLCSLRSWIQGVCRCDLDIHGQVEPVPNRSGSTLEVGTDHRRQSAFAGSAVDPESLLASGRIYSEVFVSRPSKCLSCCFSESVSAAGRIWKRVWAGKSKGGVN